MMTVTSTVGCNRKAAHTSAALVFLFNLLTFESCSPYFRVTSRASEFLTSVENSARFFAASIIAWWLP
jgi:hypothetical protein